jgi:hypothetical protein
LLSWFTGELVRGNLINQLLVVLDRLVAVSVRYGIFAEDVEGRAKFVLFIELFG